jgi:hypothetical protein
VAASRWRWQGSAVVERRNERCQPSCVAAMGRQAVRQWRYRTSMAALGDGWPRG